MTLNEIFQYFFCLAEYDIVDYTVIVIIVIFLFWSQSGAGKSTTSAVVMSPSLSRAALGNRSTGNKADHQESGDLRRFLRRVGAQDI